MDVDEKRFLILFSIARIVISTLNIKDILRVKATESLQKKKKNAFNVNDTLPLNQCGAQVCGHKGQSSKVILVTS